MSTVISSASSDVAENCFSFLYQWNAELASLYGKRLQELSTVPLGLMLCTSPDDLVDLQEDFSRTLTRDYREAWDRLGRAFICINKASSETYAATILKAQEDAGKILELARAQAERIVAQAHFSEPVQQVDGEQVQAA